MKSGWCCFGVVLALVGCEGGQDAGEAGGGENEMIQGKGLEAVVPASTVGSDEREGWVSLVPEEGNGQWKALEFGGEGPTEWKEGVLRIGEGADLSGMLWTGDLPEAPYEIELEARRTMGSDFFCGLTLPVRARDVCVTLIVGGWGGGLVGVSSIAWMDASENLTTSFHEFENNQWYQVRMVVRKNRLQGWIRKNRLQEEWIEEEQVFDADTTDQDLSLRSGAIEDGAPLSLTTYTTRGEVRGIRWRRLP